MAFRFRFGIVSRQQGYGTLLAGSENCGVIAGEELLCDLHRRKSIYCFCNCLFFPRYCFIPDARHWRHRTQERQFMLMPSLITPWMIMGRGVFMDVSGCLAAMRRP